jgi:peptidoglycan/LPS O-acetylase OafA/YrhL
MYRSVGWMLASGRAGFESAKIRVTGRAIMAADIRALTGVRGVAAVIIVIYHFGKFHLDRATGHNVWSVPQGYLPVDMFFMLSGFVMGYVYRDTFVSEPWKNYQSFLIKRIARLYPAYLVIGAFYVLKIALGLTGEETFARFDGFDVIGNLLMLVGWGLHIYPLIGVSWASSAELGSYFALPLLIIFTLKKGVAWWAACVVLSLLGIYLVASSGMGSSGPLDVVQVYSLLPLLRAFVGFTLGLATFRYAGYLDRLSATAQDVLVVAILMAIVAEAVFIANDLLVYLMFIALIAILSRDGRVAQFLFGNKLAYHLGVISYSIYLIHPLFITFAERSSRHFGSTVTAYALCVLVSCAAIWLLSYVSYRFVEIPGRQFVIGLFIPKTNAAPAAAI